MPKIIRRLIPAFAALILLLIGLVAWRSWHWERKLEAYKAELRAKGEKFKVHDLVEAHSQDASQAMNELMRIQSGLSNKPIDYSSMRYVAPGRAAIVARLDQPDDSSPTNNWDALKAQVEYDAPGLDKVQAILLKKEITAPLDYSLGFSMLLPHLAKMKSLAQHFSARALFELHEGNSASAVQDIISILRLPRTCEHDHLLISELVRIAIIAIGFSPAWEYLQLPGCEEPQLKELAEQCDQLSAYEGVIHGFELERAVVEELFAKMRISQSTRVDAIQNWFGPTGSGSYIDTSTVSGTIQSVLSDARQKFGRSGVGLRALLWKWFWSSEDEYWFLHFNQEMLEAARLGVKDGAYEHCHRLMEEISLKQNKSLESSVSDRFLITRLVVPAWEKAFSKAARIETHRELVSTAVALKRYQLRYQRLPDKLDALVPEFLARKPHDWMDGGALRYQPKTNGTYLLYSVGEDFKDDGGDGTMREAYKNSKYFLNGRDMVWPLPATPEEIAAAAAKSAKRAGSK